MTDDFKKEIEEKFKLEIAKLLGEAQKLGITFSSEKEKLKKTHAEYISEGYKPGQAFSDGEGWVPWEIEDLDPNDTVQFIPQDIESIRFPVPSINGKRLLSVDVNDLQVLYEVGTSTVTNRFFYNAYVNALEAGIARQNFMNHGPQQESTPWSTSTWSHVQAGPSFAMDLDGRSLYNKDYYEFNGDGIPVKLENLRLLATLWFQGTLDLNIDRNQFMEIVWIVFTLKIKAKIAKLINKLRRKR
jgi:hypothetical protein